jgi:hypothetical protein
MTEQIALADLVEDLAIYPRGSVSSVHVDDLVYALDAGATLPAPLIDKATRKIVDGFHRTRAWRKRFGDDAIISVEVREFADDAEMLLESGRLNSPHGMPLGRYDQKVFIIKARQLGIETGDAANALGITPRRLLQLQVREANSDDGPVPTKLGFEHLSTSYLTRDQVLEMRRARGATARSKAAELTRLLRKDMTPVATDPDLRLALTDLALAIGEALAPFSE